MQNPQNTSAVHNHALSLRSVIWCCLRIPNPDSHHSPPSVAAKGTFRKAVGRDDATPEPATRWQSRLEEQVLWAGAERQRVSPGWGQGTSA